MPKQNKELSLIEITQGIVEEHKNPIAIMDLINKALKAKGVEATPERIAQLYQDIMVHGSFVSINDAKGKQLIDLKSRQSASYLDKEETYIEDLLATDDEVVKNELREENMDFGSEVDSALDQMNSDEQEEEETEETDEIAEELGLVDADSIGEDEITIEDDEDEDEDSSDLDDITGEIKIS